MDLSNLAVDALFYAGYGKRLAQYHRREWRTKQRALHLRPLSDKVVYPHRTVDVTPVKKGRPK